MLFKFRRREIPWEVVDSKSVEPVPMYYEDEDLDIVSVGQADTCGTYVFDVKHLTRGNELSNSVLFARQQLLARISKHGFNLLLLESWRLTVLRRGKHYRVEVRYRGRPARALGKLPARRPPPFMAVLQGGP
ncbi:hypothetical protein HGRIS_007651 [Hohenbuehelia grisea]|uniref:Uncharacterized protein n=1 Tax=Hohenbuehelia grisea TaxID=104357 RepID=A0ABR3J5N1_9AGAR